MSKVNQATDNRTIFLEQLNGEKRISDPVLFNQTYPTHTLSCANEIFNIWVCRMIMLGYHFTDKPPFQNVFIHATVRDERGRKMSKSLGNGIDPVEMIEKYSADSLRMALSSLIVPGRDTFLSKKSAEELFVKWRNFGNKLWNIARFLYENEHVDDSKVGVSAASAWVWEKLDLLSKQVATDMESYRLGGAMDRIYHFVWDELADWYIEYLKVDSTQLHFAKKSIFEPLIKLLHPFIPFEKEVIWEEISRIDASVNPEGSLLVQQRFSLPRVGLECLNSHEFEQIISFVTEFRSLRGLYRIDPALRITIHTSNPLIAQFNSFLAQVAKLEVEDVAGTTTLFEQSWSGIEFSFDMKKNIPDLKMELDRSRRDLAKLDTEISKLESLLLNPGFTAKASPENIAKTKDDLAKNFSLKDNLVSKITWLEQNIG